MKKTILKSKDDRFYILFSLYIYSTIIVDIVRCLVVAFDPNLEWIIDATRNTLYIFVFAALVVGYAQVVASLKVVVAFFITSFIALLSYAAMPEIGSLLIQFVLFFFSRFFPGLCFGISIRNFEKAFYYLHKPMIISYIYAVLCFVFVRFEDYMTISYNLLIPFLIQGAYTLKSKKFLDVIGSIALVVFIIAFGARGPVVCICVASIIGFVYYVSKGSNLKSFTATIFAIVGIVLFAVFFEQILEVSLRFFPDSRTLKMMLSNNFFLAKSRNDILQLLLKDIAESPLKVRGLFADRVRYASVAGNLSYNNYAHNMIVELLFDFGLVLGGLFNLSILCLMVVSLYVQRKRSFWRKTIYIAFVPVTYVMLMFSGSMLSMYQFWIMLGLLINGYLYMSERSEFSLLDKQIAYKKKV